MKKTIYESPAISYAGMDMESFICESVELTMEVDEYQILEEENVEF